MCLSSLVQGRLHYRVKNPFALADFLRMLAATAGLLAAAVLLAGALGIGLGLLLVLVAPVPVGRYVGKRTAFGLRSRSVIVDGVHVRWDHVHEVVMFPHPNGGATFAVSVDGDIAHLLGLESDRSGFHLVHPTATPVDHAELHRALSRYAPACVTFTGFGGHGSGEPAR